MAPLHPSPVTIAALQDRWRGQERRLRAIAAALLEGQDWTVHLRGLPFVHEIPPRPGEALGRDLRGAPLRHLLRPEVVCDRATPREAAIVAGLLLEGSRTSTALPDASPLPLVADSAEDVARAMSRRARFWLARAAGRAVGVVRWTERREFADLTDGLPYAEVSHLAVLPAWRRLGTGQALLAAAHADVREARLEHVLLSTWMELGLVPWYERQGYQVRRVREVTWRDAPTLLDVTMTRRLRASAPGERATRRPTAARATRPGAMR